MTHFKTFMNSKFMTRSRTIFLGTLLAQIITFGTSFVITIYYLPEDLGLLGTLTALISIIAGSLSFRLEVAVIQSDLEEAPDVFLKSTALGMLSTTVFCLICFVLPFEFAEKISLYFIPFLLWCWAYCFFFNSKQLAFKFNELAFASYGAIWRSVVTFIFQLTVGIINPSFMGLLSGRISGDYAGGIAHCWKFYRLFDAKKFKTGWIKFLRKNRDFFYYTTPHHLCLALSNNIIIFFLESQYGLMVVGFYALGQRLIGAPIELIGATITNVTMQRFTELIAEKKDLRVFHLKVIVFSLVISCLMGGFVWIGADLFIPLLGPKWADARGMVKHLVPFFVSYLFSMPTVNFLRIINQSRLQLNLEIIEIISKVLVLALISWESSEQMVLGFGILTFAYSIFKTALSYMLITPKVNK